LKKYDPRVIVMNELGKDYSIEPLKVNLFKFITANNTCVVLRRILSTRLTHFELCKRNLLQGTRIKIKTIWYLKKKLFCFVFSHFI